MHTCVCVCLCKTERERLVPRACAHTLHNMLYANTYMLVVFGQMLDSGLQ
jgi:hypothetical protein